MMLELGQPPPPLPQLGRLLAVRTNGWREGRAAGPATAGPLPREASRAPWPASRKAFSRRPQAFREQGPTGPAFLQACHDTFSEPQAVQPAKAERLAHEADVRTEHGLSQK
ncbi:unnamed protein product [Prorocentrum cordatum]|uniref:Uncharacterized protein n=1 Tax=Prorocentrum cordatum TaxID=2364126 RepID=A0ABN9YD30_9DINO|nr:unnamed protein product [Polarella glacialis]